jgi:hypothetical protein
MFFNDFCTCHDCDNVLNFPVLPELGCFDAPTHSEVGAIIFLPTGATAPADWTSVTDWKAVFNNVDTSNAAAKIFMGIGSIAEPETRQQRIAKGVEEIFLKRWTLEMLTNTMGNTIYAFVRFLQCHPMNYRFWFWDMGGFLYGGENGIKPWLTDANVSRQSGEQSLLSATAKITYQNCGCDPERVYLPTLFDNLIFSFNAWGTSPMDLWGTSPDEVWGT